MAIGKPLLIVGSVLAFIFIAACTGGNVWIASKFSSDYSTGIWKMCIPTCYSYSSVNSTMKAIRAFAVIACLASIGGIVMAILGMFTEKVKGFLASIMLFVAAGCIALSLIIFAAKVTVGAGGKYGWSFIIGWVGSLCAIASAIVGFKAESI